MPKRVVVTGATGTLGYNIARLLAVDPRYHAILPVRSFPSPLLALGQRLELVELDICDRARTLDLFRSTQPDVIVHCAASGLRPEKPSWFDLVSFNVEATLRLFESCCQAGSAHFIYISSGLVYHEQPRALLESDPLETLHPYGASKAAADLLLKAAAVEFKRTLTIIRPFAFTGLQDTVPRLFPGLIRAAAIAQPFAMSSGDQIRDFCAAEDVSRGIMLCIDRVPLSRIETFNLGSGLALSLRQIVESVCSELDLPVKVQFGKMARPEHDPSHLVADISAARRMLGWKPTIRLAHAVWELAQEMAPNLALPRPERCSGEAAAERF